MDYLESNIIFFFCKPLNLKFHDSKNDYFRNALVLKFF